jgi:hypothetical protein
VWIFMFCLVLITLTVVCFTIYQYLEHKPLGFQTILDVLVIDLLKIVIISNSVITSVVIISRFHVLFPAIFLPPNIVWIKVCTLTYYFFIWCFA